MAEASPISFTDSTINPCMGCISCELFIFPAEVLRIIDAVLAELGVKVNSCALFKKLINENYAKLKNPGAGHLNKVTTTNIWHFRDLFCTGITRKHGREAGKAAMDAIKESVTCYAAKLHLNRGFSILNPERKANKGYAPTFEQFTTFPGRMAEAASWSDLYRTNRASKPWMNGRPRIIFLSDMGDAFCSRGLFPFLERETIPAFTSEQGSEHIWLWVTKRPKIMEAFAERLGGFPPNVCAITTVTGPDTLHRVDELRQVKASCRGLSIEPLRDRLPPGDLDLCGIDWIIIGGESGSGDLTRPFHVEWAAELLGHCRKHRVACFIKQIGRNPVIAGKSIRLAHSHGGDWDEWPCRKLRVREFPAYFNKYRSGKC